MQRRSETLAKIPLFSTLNSQDIAKLDTQCAWRRAAPTEWVISYQDDSADVFFVLTGSLQVRIESVTGRETLLRQISAGEYFGELAAIDGKPRSSGIVAVTEAIVARMPPSVFRSAIHAYPDVCDQLLLNLTVQIRSLANRVNEYSTLDVRSRLHAELIRLARLDKEDTNRAVITPPPLHADLAARISTRREAVTRELKAMEKSGLIERRRGAIILANITGLRKSIDEEL